MKKMLLKICFLHIFFTCSKPEEHLKEETAVQQKIIELKLCDVNENMNTMCNGACCTRIFVEKTNNVGDCINICRAREKCRHYIWHYTDAPHTNRKEECWVVDVEEGEEDMTYMDKDINTVSGSCIPNPGSYGTDPGNSGALCVPSMEQFIVEAEDTSFTFFTFLNVKLDTPDLCIKECRKSKDCLQWEWRGRSPGMSIDREHPNSCRLYKVWNKAVKWDSQAKKECSGIKTFL